MGIGCDFCIVVRVGVLYVACSDQKIETESLEVNLRAIFTSIPLNMAMLKKLLRGIAQVSTVI